MSRKINIDGYEPLVDIDEDDVVKGLQEGYFKETTVTNDDIEKDEEGDFYYTGGAEIVPGIVIAQKKGRSGGRRGTRFHIIYDYRPTLEMKTAKKQERVKKLEIKKELDTEIDHLADVFSNFKLTKYDDDVDMSGKRKKSSKQATTKKINAKKNRSTNKRKRCKNGHRRNKKTGRCVRCGKKTAKKLKLC